MGYFPETRWLVTSLHAGEFSQERGCFNSYEEAVKLQDELFDNGEETCIFKWKWTEAKIGYKTRTLAVPRRKLRIRA